MRGAVDEVGMATPKIIALANQKGGVGKTTSSVNLAASLAAKEHDVLLIDMDPQGNAGSGLGVYPEADEKTIYDVLIEAADIRDVTRETGIPHLKLIPSNTQLIGAEIELVGALARETRLDRALSKSIDEFDVVLLDCPPSLGLLTINALTAADCVVIPLQCEYYALEGLSHLLKTVDLVKGSLNPKLELAGILLTMYDARNNLSHQVVDEVREHFPGKVYETVIPRNVRLSEAPSHGKPALLYDVASRGAQAYMSLAEEFQRLGFVGGKSERQRASAT
jgi:chromosome partitioning protein